MSVPGGSPIFQGGGLSNFSGGVLQIFWGGSPNFFGGEFSKILGSLQFFWGSPPEYGQRSAGTHPTGRHSCFILRQKSTSTHHSFYLNSFSLNLSSSAIMVHSHLRFPQLLHE